jgi:hypothetical protein
MDENLVNLVEGYVLKAIHQGEIRRYKAALDEIEKLGALGLKSKILRNMGEAYRRVGKYKEAEDYLDKSIKIAKAIRDKTQEGKALTYLGLTYAGLAQSPNANAVDIISFKTSSILRLEDSLKIFHDIADNFLEGWVLENIGKVYLMQGLWSNALENYKKALILESESNSGFVHLGLAICYKKIFNNKLFKDECQLAHQLLSVEGMNEFTLACLEATCGRLEKSIGLLEIALNKGQTSIELISQDPYLIEIREDPRFNNLRPNFDYYEDMEMRPFM